MTTGLMQVPHGEAGPVAFAERDPNALAPGTDRESVIANILTVFRVSDDYRGEYKISLFEALDSFSDSTLTLIESNAFWSMTQAKVRPQFLNKLITKSDERLVREFMFYRHRFTKSVTHSMASEVIVGLHYLERYKAQDALEELTGKELEIAVTFLNTTIALFDNTDAMQVAFDDDEEAISSWDRTFYHGEPARFNRDIALQEVIAEYYEQADAIITYFKERRTADPVTLRKYLEDGTALQDGVL